MTSAIQKNHIAPSTTARADFKRTAYVLHRFELSPTSVARVRSATWSFGFGAFSEVVFRDNNYSRQKADGSYEDWPETIIRVVNGVMSIRKDWYLKNRLRWDEKKWQELAEEMALSFLRLEGGPPGRGYSMMGTDYVYERGSFALTNCAYTRLQAPTFDADLGWAADALFCGSGVGFECVPEDLHLLRPEGETGLYVVPDTREGWVESVELLIGSYMGKSGRLEFDYNEIRAAGSPIKGYGGVCPGAEPLRKLHTQMREALDRYVRREISSTRLKADLANQIGFCIVAGGVRRSAEMLIGSAEDDEFLDLKDFSKYPEREEWAFLSNNSPALTKREHFELIPKKIAPRARLNGEPGFLNMIAVGRFARFGREKPDTAEGINPCGELPLCNKEICTLSENYPSRAPNSKAVVRNAELTTCYTSTVSLLPTHRGETNQIVARNRRIGVGMSGIADWEAKSSVAEITKTLRRAYEASVAENERLAKEAGIPSAIRVTTVKPSGTVSLLAGVSPGGHFAMGEFYIRRKRVSVFSPFRAILDAAGYPYEKDAKADNTLVYEFPQVQQGVRTQEQAGMFEQALQLCMLQREWSDNAVSFTIEFNPETEGPQLGNLLAQIAPMTKSLSVLPRATGYAQAPYEEITPRELKLRQKMVKPLDWTSFKGGGSDEADKFCNTGVCERPKP